MIVEFSSLCYNIVCPLDGIFATSELRTSTISKEQLLIVGMKSGK